MGKNKVYINNDFLRLEFEGIKGPTNIIVPLVISPGKHDEIKIRIVPNQSIKLKNSVNVGDALQQTVSSGKSFNAGGSFFGSISFNKSISNSTKLYDVTFSPDFHDIIFTLKKFNVEHEPIGLQLAFGIESYNMESIDDCFAEILLEHNNKLIQKVKLERFTHPDAPKILLLCGYKRNSIYWTGGINKFFKTRLPFLEFSDIQYFKLNDLPHLLMKNYQGIHIFTAVKSDGIMIDDEIIKIDDFFNTIKGNNLKFIYFDTCNSVRVISAFRDTEISALIASTENLYTNYADEFEKTFYTNLSNGEYLSKAFQIAAKKKSSIDNFLINTRSGIYDPMFLDLKDDFNFKELIK